MGPIWTKVIEVKGKIYGFFSVGHVFCLFCLHRRNHLTATSRRVKFTSYYNFASFNSVADTKTIIIQMGSDTLNDG